MTGRRDSNGDGARILIVDDHPLMRESLCRLINNDPTMKVCGEAGDAHRALQLVTAVHPDLVIVDITLKQGSGLELIKDILAIEPTLSVLVISTHDESLYAERCLRAGARGYVMKEESSKVVIGAIRRILDGGVYVSRKMSAVLAERTIGTPVTTVGSSVRLLSDRELEVFQMMGKGLETRRIAAQLGITPKCVQAYTSRIKEKLHISSLTELRRHAFLNEERHESA